MAFCMFFCATTSTAMAERVPVRSMIDKGVREFINCRSPDDRGHCGKRAPITTGKAHGTTGMVVCKSYKRSTFILDTILMM